MSDNNKINFEEFKQTNLIKKLSKSKSIENMTVIDKPIEEEKNKKRGRKTKYANDEERKEARRKQQKEYRLRKRNEFNELKKLKMNSSNE